MRRVFILVAAVVLVDTAFYAAIVPLLPHYTDELGLSIREWLPASSTWPGPAGGCSAPASVGLSPTLSVTP
jgi:hypothetical protein